MRRPEGRCPAFRGLPAGAAHCKFLTWLFRVGDMNVPPLLVSFSEKEFLFRAVEDGGDSAESAELGALIDKQLPAVASARTIALMFGYSTRFVLSMAARSWKYYRVFQLQMGSKRRAIEAPRVALKVIQTWFGHHLARSQVWPSYVHGFIPGRSTVTAARTHMGCDWVFSVDLQDFFPSVGIERVRNCLTRLAYSEKATNILSRLLTIDNRLPQGSPASPVIANLCLGETDAKLHACCLGFGVSFSRYADDLVFSGPGELPDGFADLVCGILRSDGWVIADDKTQLQAEHGSKNVHGILLHRDGLRLPKQYRNSLRMMKYAIDRNLVANLQQAAIYTGHLAYAKAVYGERLADL